MKSAVNGQYWLCVLLLVVLLYQCDGFNPWRILLSPFELKIADNEANQLTIVAHIDVHLVVPVTVATGINP